MKLKIKFHMGSIQFWTLLKCHLHILLQSHYHLFLPDLSPPPPLVISLKHLCVRWQVWLLFFADIDTSHEKVFRWWFCSVVSQSIDCHPTWNPCDFIHVQEAKLKKSIKPGSIQTANISAVHYPDIFFPDTLPSAARSENATVCKMVSDYQITFLIDTQSSACCFHIQITLA